ncbi:apurinic/apyrimidinic endonuclease family protein [Roseomonas populi]|uniref:UV damage endonuclease UvsE n=1 Tax=Roseomonas populi TaxID=3121582 RepID=A0ABT1XDE5_9PROT|nr:UV damage endonuclease UvsE [Roseomonas pecuniae]MCR0985749.1 UV damage endonuclease UvsE [Roseomonas pecuniae]
MTRSPDMERRIAWVCQWLDPSLPTKEQAALNLRDTTVTYISKMEPKDAIAKLIGLVQTNGETLLAQISRTARLPPGQRAMRMGSNVLPVYSHPAVRPLYEDPALKRVVETSLAPAARAAKEGGVRLSMHPGQYTVLATEKEHTRAAAVADIEYHTDVMRHLGQAGGWHPNGAHINVHAGGRAAGIEAFRSGLSLLSQDARNLLTVENEETAYGLDDLLPLADSLPIVLDLHHHWVVTGEYLEPDDPRIARVIESWRGVRPIIHISAPKPDLVPDQDPEVLPDRAALIAAGVSARDLRAHSARLWNRPHAAWAARHLEWADIEVEAKEKNLASAEFAAVCFPVVAA